MKYIKKYFNFIKESWSPLLDLSNNQDAELISKIESLLDSGSSILEISCGNAADASKLKDLGYAVTCTDNNQDYVNNCNKLGIECILHDTSKSLPFDDNTFDLVYSRLGLHYFEVNQLEKIFSDINRVCKKYIVFSVKITNVEDTGKVILNKDTWNSLASKYFNIISSEEKSGVLYGNDANWLEIVAEK